jgi:hypothetical protein
MILFLSLSLLDVFSIKEYFDERDRDGELE